MIKPYTFPLGKVMSSSGNLCFWDKEIFPLSVKRTFWLTGVPEGGIRGVHAHYKDEQVVVCLKGEVKVVLEDLAKATYVFKLNSPGNALFLPALVWSEFTFKANSVLMVLSNREYSEEDYIRDKADFEKLQDGYRKEL